MPWNFPGGNGYQSPSLPPPYSYPTPFPMELGPLGPLAYMGLQASGIMPPGISNMSFSPTTDLYTQFQGIQQFQLRNEAMTRAHSSDVQSILRYQESFARASGADWTSLQGRAKQASQWMGSMLPMLSMTMPEAIDVAMGPRGSQTVMASQMAMASRFMFDPSSGRMGMSGAEVGQMTDSLFQNLYGTDAATARMRGLGAGRSGILMNEMLSRGLLSSPFQTTGPGGEAAGIAGLIGGMGGPGGAMAGLGTMNTGRMGDMSKVANQVRDMVKIVSSIGDLFGANGQPNAPIPELLNALDQMGRGVEYKYNAGQVESMFRNMQQATISGRISLPQLSQMVNQNAAMLQSVGADPRDAMMMTQRAVNYASAASSVFTTPFYGKMDPRSLAMASSSLEAAGVNSPAGQMAQVALYLADTAGIAGNSEFGQLAAAVKSGATTYAGGKSVLEALQGGNLRSIFTASGGSAAGFNAAAMNPEVAARYSNVTAPLTRKLQFDELSTMTSSFMAGDIGQMFGVGDASQRQEIGRRLMKSVFDKGGDFAGLDAKGQAAMMEQLAAEAVAGVTGGSVDDARRRMGAGGGSRLLSSMTGAMTSFAGRDLQGALQLFSPVAGQRGELLNASNRVGAAVSSALGDLGRFSFSQRLTNELQNLQPGEDIMNVLSRSLGGVDKSAIEKALNSSFSGGGSLKSALAETTAELRAGGNPNSAGKMAEIMKGIAAAFKNQGIDFEKISKQVEGSDSAIALGVGGVAGVSRIMDKNWTAAASVKGSGKAEPSEFRMTGELTILESGMGLLNATGSDEGPSIGKAKK